MNNSRTWIMGATLAVVAILALGWFLAIAPTASQASAAVADRQAVEDQNLAQEAVLVGLRQQNSDMAGLNDELEDLQEEVPAEADIETFIDEVTELAEESGVVMTTIAAQEPVAFTGVAASEAETAAAAAATAAATEEESGDADAVEAVAAVSPLVGRLYTIAVSISVTGTPEQVMDFTAAVQEGNRLFLATAVDFASGSEEASGTLTGHIFVVRSEAAAVVETPAG